MKTLRLLTLTLTLILTGCNMPTPVGQITGSYTSDLQYAQYDCQLLAIEVNALARRENQLVLAQEARRKTSVLQAILLGFGNGDGIEASELANVRGEKEAVRKAISRKGCNRSNRPASLARTRGLVV